jgi:flagellin-like protein
VRGQSSVVGVVLLLGVTLIALGAITASVGTVVYDASARADAGRVASDFDAALDPVTTTGHNAGAVHFAAGRLRTVDRQLRVSDDDGVVASIAIGGLVFETDRQRVAYVGDAILRGAPGNSWHTADPPVTASRNESVLVVGAARLNASERTVAGSTSTVTLATNVSHHRRALGAGNYSVAVETTAPGALERAFTDDGATVSRTDFDDDGVVSVVAAFDGQREAYLVVHDMRLEVGRE